MRTNVGSQDLGHTLLTSLEIQNLILCDPGWFANSQVLQDQRRRARLDVESANLGSFDMFLKRIGGDLALSEHHGRQII